MAIFNRLKKKSKQEEEEFGREVNKVGLEKNDMKAMILSAYLVIFPIAAGVLLLFGVVVYLIFT